MLDSTAVGGKPGLTVDLAVHCRRRPRKLQGMAAAVAESLTDRAAPDAAGRRPAD